MSSHVKYRDDNLSDEHSTLRLPKGVSLGNVAVLNPLDKFTKWKLYTDKESLVAEGHALITTNANGETFVTWLHPFNIVHVELKQRKEP